MLKVAKEIQYQPITRANGTGVHPFESLPKELIKEVFCQLAVLELWPTRQVCKAFYCWFREHCEQQIRSRWPHLADQINVKNKVLLFAKLYQQEQRYLKGQPTINNLLPIPKEFEIENYKKCISCNHLIAKHRIGNKEGLAIWNLSDKDSYHVLKPAENEVFTDYYLQGLFVCLAIAHEPDDQAHRVRIWDILTGQRTLSVSIKSRPLKVWLCQSLLFVGYCSKTPGYVDLMAWDTKTNKSLWVHPQLVDMDDPRYASEKISNIHEIVVREEKVIIKYLYTDFKILSLKDGTKIDTDVSNEKQLYHDKFLNYYVYSRAGFGCSGPFDIYKDETPFFDDPKKEITHYHFFTDALITLDKNFLEEWELSTKKLRHRICIAKILPSLGKDLMLFSAISRDLFLMFLGSNVYLWNIKEEKLVYQKHFTSYFTYIFFEQDKITALYRSLSVRGTTWRAAIMDFSGQQRPWWAGKVDSSSLSLYTNEWDLPKNIYL